MTIVLKKTPFWIKNIFFWLFTFTLFRVLFTIYQANKFPENTLSDMALSFFYAIRLDIATASIITALPLLLWSIQQLFKTSLFNNVVKLYTFIAILLVTILSLGNFKIYEEWGSQINSRSINYLLYPKEILSFVSLFDVIIFFLFVALISIALFKLYTLKVTNFNHQISNLFSRIGFILASIGILILGIRGGVQLIPINESSSYFSTETIYNHMATNNIWYLGHSISEAGDMNNQYAFTDKKTADSITEQLFKVNTSTTTPILKTNRPNIVFIVLESWTADLIESLGGEEGVTPQFNNLRKDGLLFTQMYSSGFRTDQGLVSIFSGFPAQPDNSIIHTPEKSEQLPSLNAKLAKQGYSSSFYYGGDIEFANMKTYLLHSKIETIIDKKQFKPKQLNSKWGAHDEFVLKKHLTEIGQQKEPFLSTVLTLSTHEPFEVTMETPFKGTDTPELFKKAAYYTDHCLGTYFAAAKKEEWYKNTLFVLIADHGHHYPKRRHMNMPGSHRITALLLGGALKDSLRGTTHDRVCGQHDIGKTILSQLNIAHNEFKWSNDIFNPSTKAFAYYSNENVLGWVTPSQNIQYTFASNKVSSQEKKEGITNDTISTTGRSYLQTLYQQYLDY